MACSGYSKQGGFEIYVEGIKCYASWNALFEVGKKYNVMLGAQI